MALLGIFVCAQLTAQTFSRGLTAANGQRIGFLEFRPADYTSSPAKHPMIIFLHGVGEKGNGTTELKSVNCCGIPAYIRRGFNMKATWNGKTESFVMLTPQLSPAYDEWKSFYVNELITYAIRELRIDPNRIFVTGLSLGGGGTWIYASESLSNAKRLAGIVPVVGPCQMSDGCNIANADLPVLAIHSLDDKTADPGCTTNALKEINNCGAAAPTDLIMYPTGGHAVWVKRAFDTEHDYQNPNVYEWMLAQNKSFAPNKKPKAMAGRDISIPGSAGSVTLSGGSSTDADGRIVRYIWRKIAGPANGGIGNPNQEAITVTSLKDGNYQYELKVVDNRADWSFDTVTVFVGKGGSGSNGGENQLPEAQAGPDQDIHLPVPKYILNGESSKDPDGSIEKYKWELVDGPENTTIKDATKGIAYVENLQLGKYQFRLTVTDNKGKEASDALTVNVLQALNAPPVAVAGNDTAITSEGKYFVLDGSASSDGDGRIENYSWRMISGPAGGKLEKSNAAATKVTNAVTGDYAFELTVTDNKSAEDVDTINVKYTLMEKYAGVYLYPNPAKNNLHLRISGEEKGRMRVTLFDVNGRVVMDRLMQKSGYTIDQDLNISIFRSGMYYLKMVSDSHTRVIKLIRQP